MRVDLHVHTQESDGLLSVEEVIQLAHSHSIQIMSITDHESTEGIVKAKIPAKKCNIKIIPGVELLTCYKGQEVHLLGYFNDIDHPVLQARLKDLREQRTALAHNMLECLNNCGISLEWQDVQRQVGTEGAVTKSHMMRAIYYHGTGLNGLSWRDIAQYFRPGGVAYLPFLKHTFEDAVDLIFKCGGLPVLAHPGLLGNPEIVFELLAYRPIGLEVYYAYWENQADLIANYAKIAEKYAILATGGSDYHGVNTLNQLGQIDVPMDCVLKLENYLTI